MLTLSVPMYSLWVGECKLLLLLAGLTWSKPAVLPLCPLLLCPPVVTPPCPLLSCRAAGRGEEVLALSVSLSFTS